jgi:hypothetical protein
MKAHVKLIITIWILILLGGVSIININAQPTNQVRNIYQVASSAPGIVLATDYGSGAYALSPGVHYNLSLSGGTFKCWTSNGSFELSIDVPATEQSNISIENNSEVLLYIKANDNKGISVLTFIGNTD